LKNVGGHPEAGGQDGRLVVAARAAGVPRDLLQADQIRSFVIGHLNDTF